MGLQARQEAFRLFPKSGIELSLSVSLSLCLSVSLSLCLSVSLSLSLSLKIPVQEMRLFCIIYY